MCGIAGSLKATATEDVRRMLDRLRHRGPDGSGLDDTCRNFQFFTRTMNPVQQLSYRQKFGATKFSYVMSVNNKECGFAYTVFLQTILQPQFPNICS